MRKGAFILALFAACCTALAAADKPYEWPALPDRASLEKPMGYRSEKGLIVLERRIDLKIDTFHGVTREEFIRLLVQNDNGVRNASISVNDRKNTRVDTIEGRTVAPDGTIVPADPAKDVHKMEVGTLKKKDPLVSVARVDFPAPVKGSILDLHFVTTYEGFVYFYADPATFGQNPSLKTDYTVRVEGGIPGTMWSVTLLGGRSGMGRIVPTGPKNLEIHFGPMMPGKAEPHSVPYYQRDTTTLIYMKWERYTNESSDKVSTSFHLDPRGRQSDFTWAGAPMKEWWVKYINDNEEACRNFLSHAGRAKDIDVAALAPASLPLEERLRRLYAAAQEKIGYDPNATNLADLSDVMREGQNSTWQGTLLFSYLLERAGIEHQRVLVANRWSIRFSPLITNSYLYDFADAVMVDVPGKGKRFFMPGQLTLPYGCLANDYQDSIAIWVEGKAKVPSSACTPLNDPGIDRTEYAFEGTIDAAGDLTGKLDLSEWGAPASDFRRWHRLTAYRSAPPRREDKKKKLSPEEEAAELAKRLREEASVPGEKSEVTDPKLVACPDASTDPLKVSCTFTVKSAAKNAQGDTWLVSALPPMAGYQSPFTEDKRETPIWLDEASHVVVDGYVILPAGARVVDVPGRSEFAGPEGMKVTFTAEAGERNGLPAIHSRLEYDIPAVVGYDLYGQWRAYLSALSAAGSQRCVATWTAAKELE